jgi:hypothetical protein
MRNHRPLAVLVLAALTACSGVPTRTFQIDAIDVDERAVPCLVVIGDDWAGAAQKQQLVNVGSDNTLNLTVEFTRPEMDVIVVAVPLDPSGKVRAMPKSRTESTELTDFLGDVRRLRAKDPERSLFILRKR